VGTTLSSCWRPSLAYRSSSAGGNWEELGILFDATMRSNVIGLYYALRVALHAAIGIFAAESNCALGRRYRVSNRRFWWVITKAPEIDKVGGP
jgi:hypothetical protein